jgi:hypothetical protein
MVSPPITVYTSGLCKSAPIPDENSTGNRARMVVIAMPEKNLPSCNRIVNLKIEMV